MSYSYAFMVSGLFLPVLGMLILKKSEPVAAIFAMIGGGSLTVIMTFLPSLPFGLDANVFGLTFSVILYFGLHYLIKHNRRTRLYG
ncbi:MAG: hypothetical protein ACP5DZ_11080 [Bacteroidales bacterium]